MSRTGAIIKGDKDLIKRMDRLASRGVRNRISRPAVREAAAEVRKLAKFYAGAHKDTGLLRKSIKNVPRTGDAGVYQVIGPAHGFKRAAVNSSGVFSVDKYQDPVKYAHLVELGTKPHLISPKGRSGAVGTLRVGQTFVSGAVMHPGTPPRPFMRPAHDSVNSQAIIAKRLGKELAKEARRK